MKTLALCGGVFLLACAASMLNQAQERGIDALMERTRHRPLPAGRLSPLLAVAAACMAAAAGEALLVRFTTPLAAGIGIAAVALYNGVYTPLKRRSSLALCAGAMVGALPPLVGCAAATGRVDGRAVCISLFMFLWQVPHFLLLLVKNRRDYASAGLAAQFSALPPRRLALVIAAWTLAACAAAMLFPLLGILSNLWLILTLLALTLMTAAGLVRFFKTGEARMARMPMRMLYLYEAGVYCTLIAQGFLSARRVFFPV